MFLQLLFLISVQTYEDLIRIVKGFIHDKDTVPLSPQVLYQHAIQPIRISAANKPKNSVFLRRAYLSNKSLVALIMNLYFCNPR